MSQSTAEVPIPTNPCHALAPFGETAEDVLEPPRTHLVLVEPPDVGGQTPPTRRRIVLGESLGPRPFWSGTALQRVTIVHVDDHGPLVVDGPDGPECFVAVWPTLPDGQPDRVAIREGEVEVRRWLLTDNDARHLDAVLVDWPDLHRHDILVSDTGIRPTGGTYRGGRYWPSHRLTKASST